MFQWISNSILYPWAGKTSILETMKSSLDEQGRLTDYKLPDDDAFWAGQKLRWVPGGMDGAFGHHGGGGGGGDEVKAEQLALLLTRQSQNPGSRTRRRTYLQVMQEDALGIMDPMLQALRRQPGLNADNLYSEAYWLATNAAHRNVVKFAIAVLGHFQTDHHKELIVTLGKHDEFTLYAAVAIQNSMDHPNETLFELAQKVSGWGKIHTVERLEPETGAIRDWLLREGCRNTIMYEYLACECARKGELHAALASEEIDAELYEGAGDILYALLGGGPAEDMDDYEHAPDVIGHFVRHSKTMCTTVQQLRVVTGILQFLNEDEEQWSGRYEAGWSVEQRSQNIRDCRQIVADSRWEQQVRTDVQSAHSAVRHAAVQAARALNMDIWLELFAQLRSAPKDSTLYMELMRTEDPEQIRKVTAFAEATLPLSLIGSGPAEELGIGEAYEPHRTLTILLQSLDRWEGIGAGLIAAGLKSPVVGNRNMALKALEAWPLPSWGETLVAGVKELVAHEPDSSVQERIGKLLEEKGIRL